MDMSRIIQQMLVLFLMLFIGFITGKAKKFNEDSNKVMSRVVIYIANPALLLNTVTSGQITGSKISTLGVIGIAIVYYALIPVISKLFTMAFPFSKEKKGVYEAMYCFTNLGFMGIPVINAIYGPAAVFYVAIFMIPFTILVYSYGTIILSEEKTATIEWKKILNPVVIASFVALAIYFFDIPTHAVLKETISLLGAVTTPLAMVCIGSTLALIPMKEVFLDYRMYVFAAIKLLVFPVLTWFIFKWFISDALLLGVMIIISAMPVASNVTIICTEYGGDTFTVSKGTFISTLLCLLTIPILAMTIL